MHQNKRLAQLKKQLSAKRKEARDLAEATDIPVEELEKKGTDIATAIAQIEAEIEAIKKLLDVAEEVEEAEDEVESVVEDAVEEEEADPAAPKEDRSRRGRGRREVRSAFVRFIRSGGNDERARATLRKYERRDTLGGVNTETAGIRLPLYVEEDVIQAVANAVFMRQLATTRRIKGNTNVPVISGVTKIAAIPEGADYPELEVEHGGPKLRPHKYGGIVPISYELLALAEKDEYAVEEDIKQAIIDGLIEYDEMRFLIGGGEEEGEATGLFTAAPVRVEAGAALTAQHVIDLFYSIPERYRPRGAWVMNGTTAALLRGLETSGGNPIWYPTLDGQPERLMGRPVYTSPYAPEIGEGAKPIVFGDISQYRIGDRYDHWVNPLRERYADKGQIGLQITGFGDANIAVPKAIGAIQMAAGGGD